MMSFVSKILFFFRTDRYLIFKTRFLFTVKGLTVFSCAVNVDKKLIYFPVTDLITAFWPFAWSFIQF